MIFILLATDEMRAEESHLVKGPYPALCATFPKGEGKIVKALNLFASPLEKLSRRD